MTAAAVERWAAARTFHHSLFSPERVAADRSESVTVCLPARECADTIGPIVRTLMGLREAGVLDEIVVVDAASQDGTAGLAARAGATVLQEAELMPEMGPVLGKGDAMWRALGSLQGEIVCFLDADNGQFSGHFVTGLLGPLVCGAQPADGQADQGSDGDSATEIAFVKAFYRRPFVEAGISLPEGGGRVNHLTARPALALFYPELTGIRQPLAGEVAARRELLASVPFTTGYGVEMAMLLDVWRGAGLWAIAQVDLDVHHNAHQQLQALSGMAYNVLEVVARRMERDGRLSGFAPTPPPGFGAQALVERPPLASLRARLGVNGDRLA